MDIGTYKYIPLPQKDSIRLLILQPSLSRDAALYGTLLVTNLSDCDFDLIEPYTALSYVWGDPGRTGTIVLDMVHAVTITATLAAALTDMRDASRPRRVWADALCIDQTNLSERNHQVSLMGAIYRTAHNTVIHLGGLTPAAHLILSHTPRAAAGIFPPVSAAVRAEIRRAAITDLLARPWFARVWIFQELVLSRDPWVQCGGSRARWADLVGLLIPTPLAPGGHGVSPAAVGEDIALLRVLDTMQNARRGLNAGTMVMLLKSRRGLGATDARDFVYAHLGLASDAADVLRDVRVDYSLPVGAVFGRAARYVLRTVGVEGLLGMVDAEGRDSPDPSGNKGAGVPEGEKRRLPSWAPDWRIKGDMKAGMYKDGLMNRLRWKGNFYAFVDEPPVLAVPGYHVDIIEAFGIDMPPKAGGNPDERYQHAVDGVNALYQAGGGVWFSGDAAGQYVHVGLRGREAEHEVLCRTMGGEWIRFVRQETAKRAGAEATKREAEFLDSFDAWLKEQATKQRIYVGANSQGLMRLMHDYMHPDIAGSPLEGRRFARTESGLFGVIPYQGRAGDVLVNLVGSEMGVLLRPISRNPRASADQEAKVRSAVETADLSVTSLSDNSLLFRAAVGYSGYAVEHYEFMGHCYFDGLVGWGLGERPQPDSIKLFALH